MRSERSFGFARYKHTRLAHLLQQNDRPDLTSDEKRIVIEDLVREITALWQTDELRRRKPTSLDGAITLGHQPGIVALQDCMCSGIQTRSVLTAQHGAN